MRASLSRTANNQAADVGDIGPRAAGLTTRANDPDDPS